jgi:hypothetical protein
MWSRKKILLGHIPNARRQKYSNYSAVKTSNLVTSCSDGEEMASSWVTQKKWSKMQYNRRE